MAMYTHTMLVKGDHNGPFCCLMQFGFNPPICVAAPPKVRGLFLNKSLEKCKQIAAAKGFTYYANKTHKYALATEKGGFSTPWGDITTAKVDVIVNAANNTLLGGGGVDGAIHIAAGDSVLLECSQLPAVKGVRCNTGEVVVTGAGNLAAKYIFHTVGPIYDQSEDPEKELAQCYRACLEKALELGCESIAFPIISAGVYGFPEFDALAIGSNECIRYKNQIRSMIYRFNG